MFDRPTMNGRRHTLLATRVTDNPAHNPTFQNFAVLAQHDTILVRYAALAERNVVDDPSTALFNLRQSPLRRAPIQTRVPLSNGGRC